MTPEFFYFDIGNVLLTFDHGRMCRQMAEVAGVSAEVVQWAILPNDDAGDVQWKLESGELNEDEYYEHVCQAVGARPPREELEQAASDIFGEIPETLELVRKLAAGGRRLGLLSNTNGIHWRHFFDGGYPVLEECFEVPLASFQVGSMKPEPAIYLAAVEKAGLPAEKVFFVDDKPENVAGALECGLDAVHFTGAPQLARDLANRGVEIA